LETVPAEALMMRGFDVSDWQGAVNWHEAHAAGYTFAYIKASDWTAGAGHIIDPYLHHNASAARGAGFRVGFYHFAHPRNSAIVEAQWFLHVTHGMRLAGDLVPVLDLEVTEGHSLPSLSSWKATWLHVVDAAIERRYGTMIYSDLYMLKGLQIAPTRPIWGASWGYLPAVYAHRWSLWQYSSQGRVAGIAGAVDLDHPLRPLPTIP
jgi:lysozyme